MNVDKMRHQLVRGSGEALIINGLRYGRTSADVLRNYTRPLEATMAARSKPYAEAWAQVFTMLGTQDLVWNVAPPEGSLTTPD